MIIYPATYICICGCVNIYVCVHACTHGPILFFYSVPISFISTPRDQGQQGLRGSKGPCKPMRLRSPQNKALLTPRKWMPSQLQWDAGCPKGTSSLMSWQLPRATGCCIPMIYDAVDRGRGALPQEFPWRTRKLLPGLAGLTLGGCWGRQLILGGGKASGIPWHLGTFLG